MSTPSNDLRGRHLYLDKSFTAPFKAGENIGYIDTAPVYPLAPIITTGYPLYLSANETVKHITLATYNNYFGISETGAKSGYQVTVRFFGIVWLPVGAVAVTYGDYVQVTPDIKDGSASTKSNCLPGDIIPAFNITQYIHIGDCAADTGVTFKGGKQVLKIVEADIFEGAIHDSKSGDNIAQTVDVDGFSHDTVSGSLTLDDDHIALCNTGGNQGVYSSLFILGKAYGAASGSVICMTIWEKVNLGDQSPWVVGQALRSGAARTDADTWEEIPVILRGY